MNARDIFEKNEYKIKQADPLKRSIQHWHDGVCYTDVAIPAGDAFMEIVSGPRQGNLVHIFDIQETLPNRDKK